MTAGWGNLVERREKGERPSQPMEGSLRGFGPAAPGSDGGRRAGMPRTARGEPRCRPPGMPTSIAHQVRIGRATMRFWRLSLVGNCLSENLGWLS